MHNFSLSPGKVLGRRVDFSGRVQVETSDNNNSVGTGVLQLEYAAAARSKVAETMIYAATSTAHADAAAQFSALPVCVHAILSSFCKRRFQEGGRLMKMNSLGLQDLATFKCCMGKGKWGIMPDFSKIIIVHECWYLIKAEYYFLAHLQINNSVLPDSMGIPNKLFLLI